MPAVPPEVIVREIISACQLAGYQAAVDPTSIRRNPRKFRIASSDHEVFSLWVYVWTLTPGGRVSLPNEYRIQMTSVDSPLGLCPDPDGITLVMGYEPNIRAFAGFDLNLHRAFTPGSPSIQVQIDTIRASLSCGIAFEKKTNDEIALGIRKDCFLNYAFHSKELHLMGADAAAITAIGRLTQTTRESEFTKELDSIDEQIIPAQRKRVIQEVARLTRDKNFRSKVMSAYNNKCAVTGVQLTLPEAAHILPVTSPESNDSVPNGLALAPSYHKAFDRGIIFLNEQMEMVLNEAKISSLTAEDLVGGLDLFSSALGKIILPVDQGLCPSVELIRKANEYREIST